MDRIALKWQMKVHDSLYVKSRMFCVLCYEDLLASVGSALFAGIAVFTHIDPAMRPWK